MFHVCQRWLGGMLTNFRTIKQSIDRLKDYYTRVENGEMAKLPKKEQILLAREAAKRLLEDDPKLDKAPLLKRIIEADREIHWE